ncbi:sugar transporter [Aliishimia ponticola]|uniref:Sugar transporter n=1 Tax=Aliishimia ponticola TaxID=2499833 RepID=A0A4S4N9Y8_9RHOB|nr:sugar transporter [Aliishimia ponticola]
MPITGENLVRANQSAFVPKALPQAFFQTPGSSGSAQATGTVPDTVQPAHRRGAPIETRLPPAANPGPYRVGVGDVLILATPRGGSTVEQLTGLLAASNRRQGYTVQDDGAIAIPNVGRVQVSGMTLEEVEATLFQRLVSNNIDPAFSVEIAEFNSQRVSVGGAVGNPSVIPVTLTPLYLDEVLAAAGGVTAADKDDATVRIYRDGTLYQLPVSDLYARQALPRIRLVDGDSVFVDTTYDLNLAHAYFEQRIQRSRLQQEARMVALKQLETEFQIRRYALSEAREAYATRIELDSVDRDYVYLTGEVKTQTRYPLPFDKRATLADALYEAAGGIPTRTGNVREIYVLRSAATPANPSAVTAWQLDARNVANLTLATRFELRPNDVIFVAEQRVTRWNRVVSQITPSLITMGAQASLN